MHTPAQIKYAFVRFANHSTVFIYLLLHFTQRPSLFGIGFVLTNISSLHRGAATTTPFHSSWRIRVKIWGNKTLSVKFSNFV